MEPALWRRHRRDNVRVIKPLLHAYALGYLSSVTPKLISYVRRLRNKDWTAQQKLQELARVLTGPLRLNSFPTGCASLVGGSTLLPIGFYRLCALVTAGLSKRDFQISQGLDRLIRFVINFLSGWFSFQLLNRNRVCLPIEDVRDTQNCTDQGRDPGQAMTIPLEHHRPELAGRTVDLTIYMVTRAVDAVACAAWDRWSHRRRAQNRWTVAESLVPGFADATVFAMSAAVVMWAWFYVPGRLPRTYEKWIGEVAQVDSRLIEALRRVRRGVFVYGKDTGQAPLLQSMCKDYKWPEMWGDPAKVAPIPCEMVHMGCGPNCEKHALYRFAKTFKFACATYIPLQIVLRLRSMKSATALHRALSDATQSSAFLASFVTLFYYSVCLARTRLGPKIFDAKTVTPMMWDSGLCVGAGCLMCGWSILVEKTRKRQELALFVAPRAAATVLPRLYDKKYQYRERVAFAVSAAILITCLRERPSIVRGVFGRITSSVLK
ncbi:Integral membrane protein [Penicillium digitatum]|uniref:Integral membrane protein n=3 Tax=Penicillium digitatum TaxID=36651 RepID=K9F8I1_PEND2|nr:Integral membrane protein [Penicillium digitatum Pd1]EKV04026.1 Integral membrane protein [Penicillium digitatum Pd1]EKV05404.1 Integral membrane protein [Penicillium digitatum PHI26]QQK45176.1 Integral membrane protein [Penicillium digitatum]